MVDLKQAQFPALLDMLAFHTMRYSRLLVEGDRWQEFEESKKMIKLLQAEIQMRQGPQPGSGRHEPSGHSNSPDNTHH